MSSLYTYDYTCDLEGIQRAAQIGAQALIDAAHDDRIIDAKTMKLLEGYAVIAFRPEGFCETLRARLLESNVLKEGDISFRAQKFD